jgi:VanZ family protein
MLGRVIGFALGFGLALVGILAFGSLYRGFWIPLTLIVCLAACFHWHPRLSKAPGASWLLAFFALIGLAVWMKSVGPTPVGVFRRVAVLIPPVLALASTIFLAIFIRRNGVAPSKHVIYLPVAIIFCILGWAVLFFSGSKGGADPMLSLFMDRFGMSMAQADQWVYAVRKTIHFCAYGLIGLTSYRLANPKFDLRQAAIFGLLIALSFSAFDEFHQSTTTNRSASPWDVGLDILGATTFIGLSVLRYRHKAQPPSVA